MAGWPAERYPARPVSISNVSEWVRRTGRVPDYSSTAWGGGSTICALTPLRIPVPMVAKRLWVINGGVNSGQSAMLLAAGGTSLGYGFVPETAIAVSAPIPHFGLNCVQFLEIPDTYLAPGYVWVGFMNTSATATVQRLLAPISGGSGGGPDAIMGACFIANFTPLAQATLPSALIAGQQIFPLTGNASTNDKYPVMGISGTANSLVVG